MATRTWRAALGVAAAVAAVSVTFVGCGKSATSPSPSPTDNGVSALSAQEILAKAVEAAKGQSSVRVMTEGSANGETFKLDVNMSKVSGASGTVTVGGEQVQFYATESNVWIKADKEFWTKDQGSAAAELIGSRWVKAPTSNPSFASFSNFGNYAKAMDELLSPDGAVTKGEVTQVNGQPAIILVSPQGQISIATTGQPLPIQIKGKAADAGSVTFSEWGSANVGSAPPESDTIDIEKLK